jgi:uncharacterized membrane protein SpoIIM required for sporulation
MLESIVNPKRVERGPFKMFFIGIVYASLSLLLVHFFFGKDPVLSNASGMTVVAFCIMFSLPFMYFLIKREEQADEQVEGLLGVWRIHKDAIYAFMWLFLGFLIAFSFWYIILGNTNLLNFQIETYCQINSPGSIDNCVKMNSLDKLTTTGATSKGGQLFSIIENNVYVMIFTLIFSLLFGAGAIFILVWNASVISAAIGVFSKYQVSGIPLGILRYMIHGFPEVTAYFITALAGGIFGVGIIRHGIRDPKFTKVIGNTAILLFISIIILVVAALMEVYLTPVLFN